MAIDVIIKKRVNDSFLRLMPPSEADMLFFEVLQEMGLRRLSTVNELVKFCQILSKKGGVYKMIASSLEMFAFLNGATRN